MSDAKVDKITYLHHDECVDTFPCGRNKDKGLVAKKKRKKQHLKQTVAKPWFLYHHNAVRYM